MIPQTIRGVPVDVIVRRMPVPETGFNDENDSKKYRPLCGGISISAEDAVPEIGATLGCICRRTTDDKVVALSNWHVLIEPDGAVGSPPDSRSSGPPAAAIPMSSARSSTSTRRSIVPSRR